MMTRLVTTLGWMAKAMTLYRTIRDRATGRWRRQVTAANSTSSPGTRPALLLFGIYLPGDGSSAKQAVGPDAFSGWLEKTIHGLDRLPGKPHGNIPAPALQTTVGDADDVSRVTAAEQLAVPDACPPDQPAGSADPLLTAKAPTSPAAHHRTVVQSSCVRTATIRLLGDYTIEGPQQNVVVGRPRDAWLLLGLLLEFRDAPLQRDVVVAKMWPDQDPAGSATRFWAAMKEARTKLCQALDRPRDHGKHLVQNLGTGSYRLNEGLISADVWRLRDALKLAAGLHGEDRVAALETVAECYSGPFLQGAEHEWAQSAARALERHVVQAVVQLADLTEDPARRVHWLERATAIDPMGENLFRRRMRVYAELGHLQAIHHCYAELVDHLNSIGLRPEQRTTLLYRRLTAQGD